MQKLNLPEFNFRIQEGDQKKMIFDEVRKQFIVLTPEEWVRQNFVKYLTTFLKYPIGFLSIEYNLKINTLQKRCDIVVFTKQLDPIVIVECKKPDVKIDQKVADQIVRYNYKLRVPYLIMTNGMQHYCLEIDYDKNSYQFLEKIPEFVELKM
jgi:hypothetical protein